MTELQRGVKLWTDLVSASEDTRLMVLLEMMVFCKSISYIHAVDTKPSEHINPEVA